MVSDAVKMEVSRSSEMVVSYYKTIRHCNPEDIDMNSFIQVYKVH